MKMNEIFIFCAQEVGWVIPLSFRKESILSRQCCAHDIDLWLLQVTRALCATGCSCLSREIFLTKQPPKNDEKGG
jgi:hypothetical protein